MCTGAQELQGVLARPPRCGLCYSFCCGLALSQGTWCTAAALTCGTAGILLQLARASMRTQVITAVQHAAFTQENGGYPGIPAGMNGVDGSVPSSRRPSSLPPRHSLAASRTSNHVATPDGAQPIGALGGGEAAGLTRPPQLAVLRTASGAHHVDPMLASPRNAAMLRVSVCAQAGFIPSQACTNASISAVMGTCCACFAA